MESHLKFCLWVSLPHITFVTSSLLAVAVAAISLLKLLNGILLSEYFAISPAWCCRIFVLWLFKTSSFPTQTILLWAFVLCVLLACAEQFLQPVAVSSRKLTLMGLYGIHQWGMRSCWSGPLSGSVEKRSDQKDGPEVAWSCAGNGMAPTGDPEFSSLKDWEP